MTIEKTTSDYLIIDSGAVITYSGKSDLTLSIKTDNDFSFSIEIKFVSTNDKVHKIERNVSGNLLTLTCVNFDNPLGTGTAEPLDIATVSGKKLYLNLWAYALGAGAQRYVVYTFYRER